MLVVVLRTRLLVAVSSFVLLPIDLVLGCSVPCCCRSACFQCSVLVVVEAAGARSQLPGPIAVLACCPVRLGYTDGYFAANWYRSLLSVIVAVVLS